MQKLLHNDQTGPLYPRPGGKNRIFLRFATSLFQNYIKLGFLKNIPCQMQYFDYILIIRVVA